MNGKTNKMAEKLNQKEWPLGHGPNDFKCFGPAATKDGCFENTMIADLGFFTQTMLDEAAASGDAEAKGRDSNKNYHGAVVESKKDGRWYAYFEWGRLGSTPSFQFVECSSKAEACDQYVKQLRDKNDKRGAWVDVPGLGNVLRPKPGKDCYLVRPQVTRSTGLPDARSIVTTDPSVPPKKTPTKTSAAREIDPQTAKLLKDLTVATEAYTRGAMADDSLPTGDAINEARLILTAATARISVVGQDVSHQLVDSELRELTNHLYGRIPKKKSRNAPPQDWLLTQDNILSWGQDLDAFESTLQNQEFEEAQHVDPYGGMPINMKWLDPSSELGAYIVNHVNSASHDRHNIGRMKVLNVWQVERPECSSTFLATQKKIAAEGIVLKGQEFTELQPKVRIDVESQDDTKKSNTCLMFHGTRSVNVSGLLRTSFRETKALKAMGVSITGAMFSSPSSPCAVYWASDWRKSAGYTSLSRGYYTSGDGAVKNRGAFLFLADVALGKPYVAPSSHPYFTAPSGHHSVLGKANFSGVKNDEHITYYKNQQRLRYLVEFTTI